MRNIVNIIIQESRKAFLGSVLFGIALWCFFYITLPVEVPVPLSSHTLLFIVANYIVFIAGFYAFRNRTSITENIRFDKSRVERVLKFFSMLVLFSAVIRYIDLFYVREVSFFNSIDANKFNLAKEENFSLLLGLLSVFRLLYFVPFAMYQLSEKKKTFLIISVLFFLIPLTEGLLRGSRRLILEPALLFGFIVLLHHRKKIKLNLKKIILGLVLTALLFASSQYILKERVYATKAMDYEKGLLDAHYNDFLPLTQAAQDFIIQRENTFLGSIALFYCHFGQYVVHGVYEFDHMTKVDSEPKYGLYNGFILVKLLNKAKLINYPLDKLNNPAERVTYITYFGGLYIDFRWFSLAIMFLFGIVQQKIFSLSEKYLTLKPILVLFVLVNMMMLIFNFFRAEILVTMIVYGISLVFLRLYEKRKILDSPN